MEEVVKNVRSQRKILSAKSQKTDENSSEKRALFDKKLPTVKYIIPTVKFQTKIPQLVWIFVSTKKLNETPVNFMWGRIMNRNIIQYSF